MFLMCAFVFNSCVPPIVRPCVPPEQKERRLLDAIRQVETGGHPDPANAVGDEGKSLGPYQISRAYWRDSGVPGEYEQVRFRPYAERVILSYWRRYCPNGNSEVRARVHNGGPKGHKRDSTKAYWKKVQRAMK